jgi:site-specific DNA recombinase
MRVLGVIRLSDLSDETTSPERQRSSIEKYAGAYDHEIVGWAEDIDVSGAVSPFDRKDLGGWLTDASAGRYDGLLAVRIDRVSRSLFDFLDLWRWLDKRNKTIISVTEQLDFGTPVGRLLIGILAMFAQFEREMIQARVRDSYNTARTAGRYAGMQVPLGYRPVKLEPKGWGYEVDPDYAPVVRELADRYLAGSSLRQLANWLNEHEVPTSRNVVRRRNGKPEQQSTWQSHTVSKILSSPAITGVMVTGGDALRDVDSMAVQRAEPIVDRDTWLRIQARLAENGGRTGPRSNSSPLLRVAFCGACGEPLYVSAVTSTVASGSKRYAYYGCAASMRGKCSERKIRAEVLEAIVEGALLDAAGDVPMMVKTVTPGVDSAGELAAVEEAISHLQGQILANPATADVFADSILKLRDRREALKSMPSRPESVDWEPTGQSFAGFWAGLEDRNAFLRSAGIRASVIHSDADGLPMPDPDGRVVLVIGNGLRVTVHLGDVAELRDRAAGQAS